MTMTRLGEMLSKYSLSRENATRYIEAITRMNQTQAAKEIGVSTDTIHRYKNAFNDMSDQERALLLAGLAQERLLEQNPGSG